MTASPLQRAVMRACHADVEALKPGNVAIGASAHRMTAEDFLRSAEAVVAPLTDPHLALGERIEAAVGATVTAVGCNTNLGIVLLLAPMADAARRAARSARPRSGQGAPAGGWREHLLAVLASTTVADGAAAARAIVHAHPAGLGTAPEADVSAGDPAGPGFHHTLYEAMALAATRDQIAYQYVSGYAAVLDMAAAFAKLRRAGATREDAVTATYLHQLASQPDTHIARTHGEAVATQVSQQARDAIAGMPAPPHWMPAHIRRLAVLHDALLARRINPGTTADLVVAAVFARELDEAQKF
jgi:triphosphoribosyl-dephospho-CoA synthase